MVSVISVNFFRNASGAGLMDPSTTYGLEHENSLVAGWTNTVDCKEELVFSNGPAGNYGQPSGVSCHSFRPNGNIDHDKGVGNHQFGTAPFAQTPFAAYADSGAQANHPHLATHITLRGLYAAFPSGYNVIAYVTGAFNHQAGSVSLSVNGNASDVMWRSSWASSVSLKVFYRARWNPNSLTGERPGLLKASKTSLPPDDLPAHEEARDYAVFRCACPSYPCVAPVDNFPCDADTLSLIHI